MAVRTTMLVAAGAAFRGTGASHHHERDGGRWAHTRAL